MRGEERDDPQGWEARDGRLLGRCRYKGARFLKENRIGKHGIGKNCVGGKFGLAKGGGSEREEQKVIRGGRGVGRGDARAWPGKFKKEVNTEDKGWSTVGE